MVFTFSVVSLRMCPLLIAPLSECQAIDNQQAVLPGRGDSQLLEGVSRSLREGVIGRWCSAGTSRRAEGEGPARCQ